MRLVIKNKTILNFDEIDIRLVTKICCFTAKLRILSFYYFLKRVHCTNNDKLQCFTKTFNSSKIDKKNSPGKYALLLYLAIYIRWISIYVLSEPWNVGFGQRRKFWPKTTLQRSKWSLWFTIMYFFIKCDLDVTLCV